HWLPALYPSRNHPLEHGESVQSHSTPSAFQRCPDRAWLRPLKIHRRESIPFPPALCLAENSCSESSARTQKTRTFPRERRRHEEQGKLRGVCRRPFSSEHNSAL